MVNMLKDLADFVKNREIEYGLYLSYGERQGGADICYEKDGLLTWIQELPE